MKKLYLVLSLACLTNNTQAAWQDWMPSWLEHAVTQTKKWVYEHPRLCALIGVCAVVGTAGVILTRKKNDKPAPGSPDIPHEQPAQVSALPVVEQPASQSEQKSPAPKSPDRPHEQPAQVSAPAIVEQPASQSEQKVPQKEQRQMELDAQFSQKIIECTASFDREYQSTPDWFSEQQAFDEAWEKNNYNEYTCRAAITPYSTKDSVKIKPFECLIKGLRDVYDDETGNDSKRINQSKKNITINHIPYGNQNNLYQKNKSIIYSSTGSINAHILYYVKSYEQYQLIGTALYPRLLGYKEKDIEFYEIKLSNVDHKLPGEWDTSKKQKFNADTEKWPKSRFFEKYKNQRITACAIMQLLTPYAKIIINEIATHFKGRHINEIPNNEKTHTMKDAEENIKQLLEIGNNALQK